VRHRLAAAGISRGLQYMLLAALFFSMMSLLVKIAGQRLPTYQIVLARSIISVAITWYLLRRRNIAPWGHRKDLLVFRGLVGFLALLCFFYSITHLALAEATVFHYLNPIFVAMLAPIFLRERMRPLEILSVTISMAGVVLIARPDFLFGHGVDSLDPLVVGVAAVGALLSGIAYMTVRKLGETEHPLVIVFYFPLVATVGALPLLGLGAVWPTPMEWLVLLGVGLTTQAAQINLTKGLRLEPAGRASGISYVQILFAAFWGLVFFGEYLSWMSMAGAILIVGASLVLATARRPGRQGVTR
jgi:drug/metabolite transporter (DMT)-like permease